MSSVSQDLRIVVGYIRLKVKDVQFHFFLVPDHMCLSRMFVGDQLIMLATSYWQHVMIINYGGSLHNLIAEKKSVDTSYLGSTFSLPSFLRLGQCLTLAALLGRCQAVL